MTPRDLTYVLHAMIRPTTLNPDNYYRMWMRSDLRHKDDDDSVTVRIEKQREFRRSVEERAREWKGEQQVLGHIVKSNVHRPRAMLDLEVSVHHHHHAGGSAGNDDDATARATLWKARKLMDVGYGHLLDGRLEALRACVLGGNDDNDDHHNLTLLLTLPKGRTLVARTLAGMREQGTDDVVSLFRLMPLLVTRLFAHPVMREREDRLLFVCTSAVVTYGGDDSVLTLWIATLEAAMDTAAGDLKKVLGSRPRAEFMHALLTGGAGMCARNNNGPSEGRWKGAEERFLSMLSSQ